MIRFPSGRKEIPAPGITSRWAWRLAIFSALALPLCLSPLAIGALVQNGPKLTARDETVPRNSGFGYSVSLSADGTTALIGGYKDNNSVGAAWVFTRAGSTWKQQGPKLTAQGEHGAAWFGQSVALSGDGNTALVGAPQDNISVGAAWVFTRSGGKWTQQAKLIGSKPGPTVQDGFGISVALSRDGKVALVGGHTYNDTVGAAFAYRRSGSKWERIGKILTGPGEIGLGGFGAAVALSGDGRRALVGASGDNEGFGAVWMFKLSALDMPNPEHAAAPSA